MPWPKHKPLPQRLRRKLSRALRGIRRSDETKYRQRHAHETNPREVLTAKTRGQK